MDAENLRPVRRAHPKKKVNRNFNWIWYVGAAVWFVNAALAMHKGALRSGLADAFISAVFLAAGLFFGRMARRPPGRDQR